LYNDEESPEIETICFVSCSGATHSRLVICDESGQSVGSTSGLGTNHWGIGIPECARRIEDMVERAKEEAGIPKDTSLISLGLSLSGCEQVSNYSFKKYCITYSNICSTFKIGLKFKMLYLK